jgi:Fic family protein
MFQPNYRITNNLLKYIGRIEACKEVIANAPLVPAWEAKFREDARVRTIHHGTHLEGNDLTKEQTQMLFKVHGTSAQNTADQAGVVAKERDIQEVMNYRNVMNWIDDWGGLTHRTVDYSEVLLKKLHMLTTDKILPQEQVGEYRKQQVVIRSVENGEVVFRPPAAPQIGNHVTDIMEWLNAPLSRDLHTVIRAGIAHYELVRIHPFIEGNGRTSRAFTLLILYAEGYDIKKLFSLEEYFDHDIEGTIGRCNQYKLPDQKT